MYITYGIYKFIWILQLYITYGIYSNALVGLPFSIYNPAQYLPSRVYYPAYALLFLLLFFPVLYPYPLDFVFIISHMQTAFHLLLVLPLGLLFAKSVGHSFPKTNFYYSQVGQNFIKPHSCSYDTF